MSRSDLIGLVGIVALLMLLALRMPIGLAMMLVGFVGLIVLNGPGPALLTLGTHTYSLAANYDLAVIPLFVLMGNLATLSGMGRSLYRAANAWIGHWRGGLASATILSCAGFAALSGSSVASAATMGKVCLPEMERYRYDPRLSTGTIAAGGTLGILIPPSTAFVIYAILTEQSIGRLFIAGVLPGLLLTALFVVTISLVTRWREEFGPAAARVAGVERIAALRGAAPMFTTVALTIGGIYLGVFTTAEAAAVGAFFTLAHALWSRALTWSGFGQVMLDTGRTTAMVFLILIGAEILGPFLALSGLPASVAGALTELPLPPLAIITAMLCLYVILGMFLEGFAMLVLTLPIVYPVVTGLGYDPIWFGVVMVIVLEMGLISPPVGINVFVVKGLAPHVPMGQIFAGILPFWVAMGVCLALLLAFPQIALILPGTMFN
jgi:tripartite ATP-independent transporter DctM subunit